MIETGSIWQFERLAYEQWQSFRVRNPPRERTEMIKMNIEDLHGIFDRFNRFIYLEFFYCSP